MDFPKRKCHRLKDYDYSTNGAYFITICTKDKVHILWQKHTSFDSKNLEPQLSPCGLAIQNEIEKIGKIYVDRVEIKKYVIMPNHIHMIIMLHGDDNNPSISQMIQQFKGSIAKQIGKSIWQKLFYDRVIRNKQEYQKIWRYIDENPLKWENDCFYS